MIWTSLDEFFAMGGYAPYVWGSVGAVAACLGLEVLAITARQRALRTLLGAERKGRA